MTARLVVSIVKQTLTHYQDTQLICTYQISTGKNGLGEIEHSECTPRGIHRIHSKIGRWAPENSVFVARRWTGEIYTPELHRQHPDRDWILTRILRLAGCEPGINKGGEVDTLKRYIYIHGTPDSTELGKPGSRGCIRMRNQDLIELFDRVSLNTTVEIYP